MFKVIPSLSISKGKIVLLKKGDFSDQLKYDLNLIDAAKDDCDEDDDNDGLSNAEDEDDDGDDELDIHEDDDGDGVINADDTDDDNDGTDEILIIKNMSYASRHVEGYKRFKSGEIHALSWNGIALGGGTEVALASDIRIAGGRRRQEGGRHCDQPRSEVREQP